MYTFRALECIVSKNHETLQANNADSVIEATKLAAMTLRNTCERLEALMNKCVAVDDETIAEFPYLRDEILALIAFTSHDGKPLFDGHIDVDIGIPENPLRSIRIHIPDLIGRFNQYRTNYKAVASNTIDSFADRMRESDSAIVSRESAVQGVRINTFIQKSPRTNRLSVINSLHGLTGLHGISFGNAMVAPVACRDTGMPLSKGCLLINGVEVSACDGTIQSLTKSINSTTKDHGVVVIGKAHEKLVLIDIEGRCIRVKVRHQAGAILSGFPCGSSYVKALSNGLIVWLSFRHLDKVTFDSQQTAQLMSGDSELELALRSGMLASLSIETPYDQRLTLYVLEIVKKTIEQEYSNLLNAIERLKMLLHPRVSLSAAETALINKN